LNNGIVFGISKETQMKIKKKKQKKRKRLIVQILVADMENGEYYVDTEQLSDIPIPLTKEEVSKTTSFVAPKEMFVELGEQAVKYRQNYIRPHFASCG
jgi:hypothetical protein